MENEILLKLNEVYEPSQEIQNYLYLKKSDYEQFYKESIENPEGFWGKIAENELFWFSKFEKVMEWEHPKYQWFIGGKMNITYNCLDRHIKNGKRNKVAFIYTNEDNQESKITYGELHEAVCRFANGLKSLGVGKGDTVTINMPMMIEQVIAVLACARIGAIHSVVFGGFSPQALKIRIQDANSKVVITSSWTKRRGKKIFLKSIVDEAVEDIPKDIKIIVAQREGDYYEYLENEIDFHKLMESQSPIHEPEWMDSEDPLFILYTSGTTGKPKGVLHSCAGYNLQTHITSKYIFNINEDDVFWCTADIGWITGHSYVIYGPLSVGATILMVEGAPDYPDPGRWWKIIDKYRVNIFYTSPTAIRMFMKHGVSWVQKYDLSSLKILGTVGEPINPEAWLWYYENIGRKRCVIVDTWWQTETGGHMIATLPSLPQKPGKAGLPFFGVKAEVVNKKGEILPPNTVGYLVIQKPWISALRNCWGDEERFNQYWSEIGNFYFAGDLAAKDEDGYIMILGRADDVLSVSGHRIGTAEVESAIVSHKAVAEAAVIGKPHEIKGESIKAFVILKKEAEPSEDLKREIKFQVRKELGSLAVPDEIEFVETLYKTRSGKIMRRVLKARELGQPIGDISTLED
jgi:acetyl-CoA synthetase